MGKHCNNLQCFKEKKTTKQNSQPAQYEKKIDKNHFEKKKKKKHIGKHFSNP